MKATTIFPTEMKRLHPFTAERISGDGTMLALTALFATTETAESG